MSERHNKNISKKIFFVAISWFLFFPSVVFAGGGKDFDVTNVVAKMVKEVIDSFVNDKLGSVDSEEGPFNFDYEIIDVPADGNCLYRAIAHQLILSNHDAVYEIPQGTEPHDFLRLRVADALGIGFSDGEWSDYPDIIALATEFNLIIGIVDASDYTQTFVYHYVNGEGERRYTNDIDSIDIGNRVVVRILYTGDHYLSLVPAGAVVEKKEEVGMPKDKGSRDKNSKRGLKSRLKTHVTVTSNEISTVGSKEVGKAPGDLVKRDNPQSTTRMRKVGMKFVKPPAAFEDLKSYLE